MSSIFCCLSPRWDKRLASTPPQTAVCGQCYHWYWRSHHLYKQHDDPQCCRCNGDGLSNIYSHYHCRNDDDDDDDPFPDPLCPILPLIDLTPCRHKFLHNLHKLLSSCNMPKLPRRPCTLQTFKRMALKNGKSKVRWISMTNAINPAR